ncbi:uncharacterized protein J4E92_010491 [Alternaria infectoria]|uniref:uncharacterized protein n=1 Tax=Alternaria infectoria TaxID=45303 RepID=UPI002221128D|nr:uncharacterized protein J4E92_010491 [Alternaria infectoria]KAI4909875.1 hypothetical protein J4E92_010491 [Alternaria infectoria]
MLTDRKTAPLPTSCPTILHGCKSAYCDTPTCLSSGKRNASRPHRPPTLLTATALAHYLAGQDNPNRGLCPHELKIAPESFDITNGLAQHAKNHSAEDYLVYPSVWQLAQQRRQRRAGDNGQQDQDGDLINALKQRQQARKDPKALSQNLYDSLTMIYSYTTQIPTPASVLASLRKSEHTPAHDARSTQTFATLASQTDGRHADPSTRPTLGTNDSNTSRSNENSRIVRQHSHLSAATRDSAQPDNAGAEVLTNGHHVHRIPYHPSNGTTQRHPPSAAHPTAVDGASDLAMLSISKTGKKSFTIGGTYSAAAPRAKPSSAATELPKNTLVEEHSSSDVPVIPTLNCNVLDELKDDVHRYGKSHTTDFNYVVDFDRRRRTRRTKPLVNRSLFYTLSDPQKLLASFHDTNQDFKDSPLPHLDSSRLANSFRDWNHRNGALIFDSLWLALDALFVSPPELDVQKSPRLRPSRKGASNSSPSDQSSSGHQGASRYLETHEAAHIVMICIHALTSLVPLGWPHTWAQIRRLRSWGVMVPTATPNTDAFAHPYMDIIDELEYEPAVRLADRLLRAIGMRTCYEHILASLDVAEANHDDSEQVPPSVGLVDMVIQHLEVVERVGLATKMKLNSSHDRDGDPGWTVTATFMEWLRTIIVKKWDSKAEINKWSSVGTAVMVLDRLHSKRQALHLHSNMFEMPILDERIDTVNEPINYLTWEHHPNTLHVFEYPCLFSAQHLVAYFRTINFTEMMKQYDHTMRTHQMQKSLEMFLKEPYWWIIKRKIKTTLSEYLVLDVSREEPLKDTLDQLWGMDKRMLLKPLKVKMGHNEGEVGADHGGVTYEFFRVVLSEAFRPENGEPHYTMQATRLTLPGMFTIDPQTHMTWFQPGSFEPPWKFQMLGILFSLAVYNGITLPVTFPLAFYEYLQTTGNPRVEGPANYDPIDYISDGWPSLAESFRTLLSWSDGDVADVFMREYVFSYSAFGQPIDQNLGDNFPALAESYSPIEEPGLVTNENRAQYVKDYVRALTYSSVAPNLIPFLHGFLTCIHPKSLHLFTPSSLRHLIEGTQHISITDLKRCAKYEDGYTPTHSNIRNFWDVVEHYSQEELRLLLEFVTASDRVPVTGYESITFHIVRIMGSPGSLPSSSTCFGKLYLPDYGDRGVLEGKLGLAIRNSKGFGNV